MRENKFYKSIVTVLPFPFIFLTRSVNIYKEEVDEGNYIDSNGEDLYLNRSSVITRSIDGESFKEKKKQSYKLKKESNRLGIFTNLFGYIVAMLFFIFVIISSSGENLKTLSFLILVILFLTALLNKIESSMRFLVFPVVVLISFIYIFYNFQTMIVIEAIYLLMFWYVSDLFMRELLSINDIQTYSYLVGKKKFLLLINKEQQ